MKNVVYAKSVTKHKKKKRKRRGPYQPWFHNLKIFSWCSSRKLKTRLISSETIFVALQISFEPLNSVKYIKHGFLEAIFRKICSTFPWVGDLEKRFLGECKVGKICKRLCHTNRVQQNQICINNSTRQRWFYNFWS